MVYDLIIHSDTLCCRHPRSLAQLLAAGDGQPAPRPSRPTTFPGYLLAQLKVPTLAPQLVPARRLEPTPAPRWACSTEGADPGASDGQAVLVALAGYDITTSS
jgi:hypothetical protein